MENPNDIAERQGWTTDTFLSLVLRFIEESERSTELVAYLQKVAAEENSFSAEE